MSYKKNKISVIMSTYNRENFLPRSIESILSQTYTNFEFILVNNGSTDGSYVLCKEYSRKDSRIKVIDITENHGASNGKNKGIDVAKCEFITFVDDDDYCAPEMLEFLWNLRSEYDADISICGSWYDFNGRQEPKFISDELLVLNKVKGIDELLKRKKYNISPPTKLYQKSLFTDIRFKENVIVDDIHTIYKVFAKANTVVFQGKPLYSFVRHGDNLTSFNQTNKLSFELLDEYLSAFSERTKYLSKNVPEIAMRARYSEWSYMISMCDKIKKYNCIECMELYDYMVGKIRENYNELTTGQFITERERILVEEYINQEI